MMHATHTPPNTPATDAPGPAPRATGPRGAPRRGWRLPLALFVAGLLVIPLDGPISRIARGVQLGGDIRRELELLQQFGAPASVLIALLLTIALDPARARRFLDWAAAAGVVAVTALAGKAVIGRPRPKLDEPHTFLGPFRTFPLDVGDRDAPEIANTYAWQLGADRVEQLWSMPSSHTTAAVVFAAFLATVWPRLGRFAAGFAALVMICRVLFGAHYVSDVLIGAALALAIARPMIANGIGVRLTDSLWIRFVDRNAEPRWPPGTR